MRAHLILYILPPIISITGVLGTLLLMPLPSNWLYKKNELEGSNNK
jgi:hypothetical protein